MDKIKIFVALHKPTTFFHDSVYIPIYVGSAFGKYNEEMRNYCRDDSGYNISLKNPFYSELTAHFWIWKNVKNVEYVGLCHYRRYFETKFSVQNIDKILGIHHDVVLSDYTAEKISLATRLQVFTTLEDFYIFYKCLLHYTPGYEKLIKEYLSSNCFTPFNMFVMKKNLFDDFSRWQFAILSEVEKHILFSPYTRGKRVLGYLSEVLLLLYCKIHNLKIHFEKTVPMIGEHSVTIFMDRTRKAIRTLRFNLLSPNSLFFDPTVYNGLIKDKCIDKSFLEELENTSSTL